MDMSVVDMYQYEVLELHACYKEKALALEALALEHKRGEEKERKLDCSRAGAKDQGPDWSIAGVGAAGSRVRIVLSPYVFNTFLTL